MNGEKKIPIRNIYWMLCYAWNTLSQAGSVEVGSTTFNRIENLLAHVLINGLRHLIKRGFYKEYCLHRDDLSLVRGRIDIDASVKRQTGIRRQVACVFDEFTPDVAFNQVIKWTIHALLKNCDVSSDNKRALRKLSIYFSTFHETEPTAEVLNQLMYSRNNQHYRILMNVSRFVYLRQMADERGRQLIFFDFVRDRKMETLYEKFVGNFYKIHLPTKTYCVSCQRRIYWQVNGTPDSMLPQMRADVTIENKVDRQRLIMDTKFYRETLRAGPFSHTKKLISAHLYQIYAYLGNDQYSGDIAGMLLYPTVDVELNLDYVISGHTIMIRTLNLANDWPAIKRRLMDIVKD